MAIAPSKPTTRKSFVLKGQFKPLDVQIGRLINSGNVQVRVTGVHQTPNLGANVSGTVNVLDIPENSLEILCGDICEFELRGVQVHLLV